MLSAQRSWWLLAATTVLLAACSSGEQASQQAANPCNPCAAVNPCNPCAAANPCVAANPCAAGVDQMVDVSMIKQGDKKLNMGGLSSAELIAKGKELYSDKKLSGTGTTACSTCHQGGYAMMNASFAQPYPHEVKMAKERAGLDKVTAAEMVQLCMVIPMQNKPLDYNSVELAALTEYMKSLQKGFDPAKAAGMNPCNPCAGMNPCNPCAAQTATKKSGN